MHEVMEVRPAYHNPTLFCTARLLQGEYEEIHQKRLPTTNLAPEEQPGADNAGFGGARGKTKASKFSPSPSSLLSGVPTNSDLLPPSCPSSRASASSASTRHFSVSRRWLSPRARLSSYSLRSRAHSASHTAIWPSQPGNSAM
eukprot:CAMPEP_0115307202 /NCGR_PEP_ID=MMETSP0270-20121206/73008_1 /TAXON_ID=71861 /ORGANISM="Scrippsiella trochoidea, Strain CCMP3099" /LENGTH=142 /DNA_ID=CAMNT_0002725615 /DNA_START=1117 /DNA_END=1546 /DNA_ORIENTATION=-